MSKNKQPKKAIWPVLVIVLAALCVAVVMIRGGSAPTGENSVIRLPHSGQPSGPNISSTTEPSAVTEPSAPTEPEEPTGIPTEPSTESPEETVTEPVSRTVNLGYGLELTDSGKYTGLYMEDGSNEVLSDVMMIIVENNGDQDIQLAQISAVCGGEEYSFTLTNLAVGARAVLLEQERKSAAELTSAVMDTCALFQEPMSTEADRIQVSGLDGMVNVKNISGADISGDIYVYYKYAADDIYYGGVTFRVRVEGGLKAGEIRQIPAGHYTAVGSEVVQVTIHE